MCGDLAHTGQSIDSIHANSFACKGVELAVAQTNSAVLINSTTLDNWPPPFARAYRLRTEQLNTGEGNRTNSGFETCSILQGLEMGGYDCAKP